MLSQKKQLINSINLVKNMFTLYKSYNFHLLLKKACSIFINKPLKNPLKQEFFIIPNKETEHWINIYIAKKYSIVANIKFLQFNNFIWEIFQKVNSRNNLKLEFERYHIIWKIMNIKNVKNFTNFISKSNSTIKLFEIVSYLSKQFEKFLLYRSDWIYEWTTNLKKKHNLTL